MASDEQYVEFVRARTPALLRTARLLTAGDGQAAEDLVQTAVTQGFVKRGRIRDSGAIEAYVSAASLTGWWCWGRFGFSRPGSGRLSSFATTTICRRLRSPLRWAARGEL